MIPNHSTEPRETQRIYCNRARLPRHRVFHPKPHLPTNRTAARGARPWARSSYKSPAKTITSTQHSFLNCHSKIFNLNNPGRTRYVLEKSWAVNGKIDFYVKEREGRRRKEKEGRKNGSQ